MWIKCGYSPREANVLSNCCIAHCLCSEPSLFDNTQADNAFASCNGIGRGVSDDGELREAKATKKRNYKINKFLHRHTHLYIYKGCIVVLYIDHNYSRSTIQMYIYIYRRLMHQTKLYRVYKW